MGSEQDSLAERRGLQHVLAAVGHQAAAHEGHVPGGVEPPELPDRVHQQHFPGGERIAGGLSLAPPDACQAGRRQPLGHRRHPLWVSRCEDQANRAFQPGRDPAQGLRQPQVLVSMGRPADQHQTSIRSQPLPQVAGLGPRCRQQDAVVFHVAGDVDLGPWDTQLQQSLLVAPILDAEDADQVELWQQPAHQMVAAKTPLGDATVDHGHRNPPSGGGLQEVRPDLQLHQQHDARRDPVEGPTGKQAEVQGKVDDGVLAVLLAGHLVPGGGGRGDHQVQVRVGALQLLDDRARCHDLADRHPVDPHHATLRAQGWHPAGPLLETGSVARVQQHAGDQPGEEQDAARDPHGVVEAHGQDRPHRPDQAPTHSVPSQRRGGSTSCT